MDSTQCIGLTAHGLGHRLTRKGLAEVVNGMLELTDEPQPFDFLINGASSRGRRPANVATALSPCCIAD